MRAYILAGGLGTRLYPYSLIVPKPLLAYGNKSIIEHVLDGVAKEGMIDEAVIVTSGREGLFKALLGESYKGIRIRYHTAEEPLGTAGQLLDASHGEQETFLCLYSDSILKFSLKEAVSAHRSSSATATILTFLMPIKLRYGVIETVNGLVKSWDEKPRLSERVAVGGFIFEPEFLKYIRKKKYGMNDAINEAILAGERILAFDVQDFVDLGSKDVYLSEAKRKALEFGDIP